MLWKFTSSFLFSLPLEISILYVDLYIKSLTFRIFKIPHLLELGVNAVELLPVFEFDELEFQRRSNPRDHMVNFMQ